MTKYSMKGSELRSLITYRDASMLILNKPTGIPVHVGAGKLKPLEAYFEQLKFGLSRIPALAHRLDKDTSGCLVLGRHPQALRKLNELFAQRKITKTYWAIVKGRCKQSHGTIDMPLAPQVTNNGWRMIVDSNGKPSTTDYRVLGQKNDLTWLELTPQTGRTHQLRVHCDAMGMPILGDTKYGNGSQKQTIALCLHARSLVIPFYHKKDPIQIEVPPPNHMATLIANFS